MKRRRILFILLLLYFGVAYSQITTDSTKGVIATKPIVVNQFHVFLSAKATMIRKDAVQLNLRPKMAMDQMNKMINTLSIVLKKISDTSINNTEP
jgi:hypothetical protein